METKSNGCQKLSVTALDRWMRPVANNNRLAQALLCVGDGKPDQDSASKTNFNYLQLDLELKDGKSAGDTSSFITNGEWELIGNDT